ncbi:MAG: Transposase [Pseudomonadota bacterium]|jgi:transposase-like protein
MTKTSPAQWAKLVERWQDSGLTAKEFAVEHNVSPALLGRWKRDLRKNAHQPVLAQGVDKPLTALDALGA